jgi:hypothetical protein
MRLRPRPLVFAVDRVWGIWAAHRRLSAPGLLDRIFGQTFGKLLGIVTQSRGSSHEIGTQGGRPVRANM